MADDTGEKGHKDEHAGPGHAPTARQNDSSLPVVWISDRGIELAHLREGGARTDHAPLLVSPGSGKVDARVAATHSALAVAWQESTADGLSVVKLRGVLADGLPFGSEITVGERGHDLAGGKLDCHSLSICGYDLSSASDPDARDSGFTIAWVASDPGDSSPFGRIMLQRYQVVTNELGVPVSLAPADLHDLRVMDAARLADHPTDLEKAVRSPANDDAIWVGDEDGEGVGGVYGCDPAVANLRLGDTLIAWLGRSGHVQAKLYSPAGTRPDGENADGERRGEHTAINALLADLTPGLDPAAISAPEGSRRVKVVELGASSFAIMWVVATGASYVAQGSIFSGPGDTSSGSSPTNGWSKVDIAPFELRSGFTGEFTLAGAGDGHLVVTYQAVDETGTHTYARHIAGADWAAGGIVAFAGAERQVGDEATNRFLDARDGEAASRSATAVYSDTAPDNTGARVRNASEGAEAARAGSAWAAGEREGGSPAQTGDRSAGEGMPIVRPLDNGVIVAWQTGDASAGPVSILLSFFDPPEAGNPTGSRGRVITVADDADGRVAPAVFGAGAAAVVVYVDADEGALIAKAYDAEDGQIGVPIVVDTRSHGAISEIDGTAQRVEGQEGADYGWAFAVVYVQGADENGYGNVMLQRYGIPVIDGEPQSPVALGRDGVPDGTDAAVQLVLDGDGDAGTADATCVVGRGIEAAGLRDGQLAIAWVELVDLDHETIRGAVIEPTKGDEVLRIDLTDVLPPSGIAKGTKPIVSAMGDGDFLISWLQQDSDGDGGYVIMTAHYQSTGAESWTAPSAGIRLQDFAGQPEEFSVTVAGEGNPSIVVTWREGQSGSDDGIYGQRFDIQGNRVGRPFDVDDEDADSADREQGDASVAVLPDGGLVVAYTQGDPASEVDVKIEVFDAGSGGVDAADEHAYGSYDDMASAADGDQECNLADALASDLLPFDPVYDRIATGEGEPVLIDVPARDSHTASVAEIAGVAVSVPGPGEVAPFVLLENGAVQLRADGAMLFTPNVGFSGPVDYSYSLRDGEGRLVPAEAHIDVVPATAASAALGYGMSAAGYGDYPSEDARDDGGGAAVDDRPAASGADADAFYFSPHYGNDAVRQAREAASEVIDLSSSAFTTFEALLAAGALAQVGDDVVITLDPTDPANSDKITLKSVLLSALDATDFKFS